MLGPKLVAQRSAPIRAVRPSTLTLVALVC
jgi:hypothetical protein